jgi:hypothetical protein
MKIQIIILTNNFTIFKMKWIFIIIIDFLKITIIMFWFILTINEDLINIILKDLN